MKSSVTGAWSRGLDAAGEGRGVSADDLEVDGPHPRELGAQLADSGAAVMAIRRAGSLAAGAGMGAARFSRLADLIRDDCPGATGSAGAPSVRAAHYGGGAGGYSFRCWA